MEAVMASLAEHFFDDGHQVQVFANAAYPKAVPYEFHPALAP